MSRHIVLVYAVLIGGSTLLWSGDYNESATLQHVLSETFDRLYSARGHDDVSAVLTDVALAVQRFEPGPSGSSGDRSQAQNPVLFSLAGFRDAYIDQLYSAVGQANQALRSGDRNRFLTKADLVQQRTAVLRQIHEILPPDDRVAVTRIDRVLSLHDTINAIEHSLITFERSIEDRASGSVVQQQLRTVQALIDTLYEQHPELRGLYDVDVQDAITEVGRLVSGWGGFALGFGYGTDFVGPGVSLEVINFLIPERMTPDRHARSARMVDVWLSAGRNSGIGGMRTGFGYSWRVSEQQEYPRGHYLGYHVSFGHLGHGGRSLYWPEHDDASIDDRFRGPQFGLSYTYAVGFRVNSFVRVGGAYVVSDANENRIDSGAFVVTLSGGFRFIFSEL